MKGEYPLSLGVETFSLLCEHTSGAPPLAHATLFWYFLQVRGISAAFAGNLIKNVEIKFEKILSYCTVQYHHDCFFCTESASLIDAVHLALHSVASKHGCKKEVTRCYIASSPGESEARNRHVDGRCDTRPNLGSVCGQISRNRFHLLMPVAASVLEKEPQQLTTSFTRRSALLKAAINLSTAEHNLSWQQANRLNKQTLLSVLSMDTGMMSWNPLYSLLYRGREYYFSIAVLQI